MSASDGETHPCRSPSPDFDNEDMPEDSESGDFEKGREDENGVTWEEASEDCDVPAVKDGGAFVENFEDIGMKSVATVQEDRSIDDATVSAVVNDNNQLTWNETAAASG